MSFRDSAISTLRSALPELRSRFGVTTIALFGSVARGDDSSPSDLDVLVTFDPAAHVTLMTLASLTSRLEALLGRRVDLVEDHPRLRPTFRQAIQRDMLRVA